ncbi:hypothetical protein [Vibrio sp. WXL103]|uniref:hypothetical protein n=1 Tax=Vibrio sp. WXL103 TaxID=3450710 RepID=UPI003EC4B212
MSELYTEPQEIIERKERVKSADTLFSWECTPPRNPANDWFLFILASVFSGGAGYLMRTDVVMMILGVATVLLVVGFLSFTAYQPHHYKYELTREGIRVTDEERVPEIVFTIIRGLAWFGVIACLIAVVVVGPMAFVGAGTAALGAFSFTGFKKKPYHYELYFYNHSELRYFEGTRMVKIVPLLDANQTALTKDDFSCHLQANKEDYLRLVEHIRPLLDSCQTKVLEEEMDLWEGYDS